MLEETEKPRSNVHPVSVLQEWVQQNIAPPTLPVYHIFEIAGTQNPSQFLAIVCINNKLYGYGRGISKSEARKTAAENVLARIRML
jgi:dsRNA-specific ribonuclease